ncbi:RNA methyltransferase [Thermanaerothrix sp. 4228-RoL]|uniref:RNA methyltransferase n=1 Tax=Thermanaerothrix solaris TaxID=3058434 RepID=A0ABU3NSD0_9CHLR|nr:RNA methyltransferase [Thermanaerothrix sp. 4228-RoL]MDT8899305.1 RNA methyltransferase [Thermanaerothrix sp. 4228-RoL]
MKPSKPGEIPNRSQPEPVIHSRHNARFREVRALIERRHEREEKGLFVAEGVRLCEEIVRAGWHPQYVLYSEQLSERGQRLLDHFRSQGVTLHKVSPELMASLADTETPQGILCVLPIHYLTFPTHWDFGLVLDGIKDPGNAGTLLRTAWAAKVDVVITIPGTTDLFAPKVVRAAMGAHFYLPIHELKWPEIEALAKQRTPQPARVLLAEAQGGIPYWDYDLRQPLLLVIGSEAEGPSPEAHHYADTRLTIPMPGQSESLNAAIAAAILLFEVVRQRQTS